MVITEVRVFPVEEDKLKAFASIVIDDAFVVSDIKIIEGKSGRFLSMPSARRKNGTFRDIAHPLNAQTRRVIEERIFSRYDEVMREIGRTGRLAGTVEITEQRDPLDVPHGPRHAAL